MKKILFGILLIFLSLTLIFLGEFKNITISSEKFESVLCAVLLMFGFVFGIWGLFEKDR